MPGDGEGRSYGRLTAPQVAEDLSEQSIICLPVGSLEQHGPHLPLNTDTVIAERFAARLATHVAGRYAGELVIVPTARWYMICADASNADASGVIFQGKRRPSAKPLSYVAPSLAVCEQHFQLGAEARELAEMFWPGDLALLLPWRNPEDAARHAAVGSPALTTIAPGVLGELAARAKVPVAATTANISGDAGPDDLGPL